MRASSHDGRPKKVRLPNPGQFDMFNAEAKNMLEHPGLTTGARFTLQRNFFESQTHQPGSHEAQKAEKKDKQFILATNMHLALPPTNMRQDESSADLTLVTKLPPRHELMAQIDTSFSLTGKHTYKLKRATLTNMFKLDPNQPLQNMLNTTLSYRGADFRVQLDSLAFEKQRDPKFGVSYFQSVTPALSLGVKAFHDYPKTHMTYIARYKNEHTDKHTNQKEGDVLTLGYQGATSIFSVEYLRRLGPGLSLATGFTTHPPSRGSAVNAALQLAGNTYMMTMGIDSQYRVFSELISMMGDRLRLNLAAELNHSTGENAVGIGLSLM